METDSERTDALVHDRSKPVGTDDTGKSTKRLKKFIGTLDALIRENYGSSRAYAPSAREQDAMNQFPTGTTSNFDELFSVAAGDVDLSRTRKLFVVHAGMHKGRAADLLGDFLKEVLSRSPVFMSKQVQETMRSQFDPYQVEASLKILATQNYSGLPWPDSATKLSKASLKKCKTNAIHCFLMRLLITAEMPIWFTLEQFRRFLWPDAGRKVADQHKLNKLLHTKDPAGLSVLYDSVGGRVEELNQEVSDLRRRVESATESERLARQEGTAYKSRVGELETLIVDMQQKARNTKTDYEDQIAVLKDINAKLQGRVLRRIRAELQLLEDGLTALKRQPPKVNVMLDHAERAIEGLRREADQLSVK